MKDLRPYQIKGANFLASKNFSMLCDDMGLGKTVQAIAATDQLDDIESILIICPATVRENWQIEFDRWSMWGRDFTVAFNNQTNPTDFFICSYEYATSRIKDLKEIGYSAVIVDEAHYLKSFTAKRSKAVLGMQGLIHHCRRMWLLTGTPAPNDAGELWIYLVVFGVIDLPYGDFIAKYCLTADTGFRVKVLGVKKEMLSELIAMMNKIMLRRKKEDVLKELPPITFSTQVISPGPVVLEESELMEYSINAQSQEVLAVKLESERAILNALREKNKEGFSFDDLAQNAKSISTLRKYSALQKIVPAIEIIASELEENQYEKVVIFAYHTQVVKAVAEGLKKFGVRVIAGFTSNRERDLNVKHFQNKPNVRVFVGNIKAAGVGITLTAAHTVIFIEQSWVPAENAQAAMRCHRIGQEKPVFVRFLAVRDFMDDLVTRTVEKKTEELSKIFI
jgi:SWI/SNF-related matrix-associated actin-dependent regulator of chromatin subfamily A-like protein 1